MTECLVAYFQENIPSFFATALFWAFFFVELRHLLALRAGRAGAGTVVKWQYVNTLLTIVLLYLLFFVFVEARTSVYIPGESDCETALMESGVVWVVSSIFLASFWALALSSYAACAVVGDRACTALIPVIVLRTLVTGFLTWLFLLALIRGAFLWHLVIIYFALFALCYIMRT